MKNTTLDKDAAKSSSTAASSSSALASAATTIASSTLKPGLLTVTVSQAKGLSMPPGFSAPSAPAVNRHARIDSTRHSRSNAWWLPYLLVECDKNEVLIDAIGQGSTLESPRWEYKTTL